MNIHSYYLSFIHSASQEWSVLHASRHTSTSCIGHKGEVKESRRCLIPMIPFKNCSRASGAIRFSMRPLPFLLKRASTGRRSKRLRGKLVLPMGRSTPTLRTKLRCCLVFSIASTSRRNAKSTLCYKASRVCVPSSQPICASVCPSCGQCRGLPGSLARTVG